MRELIRLILIISTIALFSCNKPNRYVITGNLTGFPDRTMIYLKNLSTDETFDSTLLVKNKFKLVGQLNSVPEQLWLNAKVDNQFIYTNLLIGNEDVQINGDIKDFPWTVEISGSKTQDDFNYLRNLTNPFNIKRDSLVQSFLKLPQNLQQEKGKEIWDRIKTIDDTTLSINIAYIKSHIDTYPGIINLGYFKNSLPKDTVLALYNKMSDEIKASKYAKIVEIYLNEKISEIGDTYHDFEAFTINGDKTKFSKLVGKYILLDFTGAYCGPCIQSVDELKLIDNKFSDSLLIVSVSTDTKKEIWLSSLKRDSASWISLWDGKGTYSETYIKYGVRGIPTFFLIDPFGKIIDKWTGYGKGSLENKLKRFKNN